MRGRRKETIIMILILLFAGLGIGYAFLTTTLNIDGTADIDDNTWNIYWDNVQEYPSSLITAQVITPATISTNKTKVSYHIKFSEPGEAYGFTIDAVNAGTMNAEIEDIIIKVNGVEYPYVPPFLESWIEYDSGDEVSVGDPLFAGESKTINYYIEYLDITNPEDLPTENISLNISIEIVYKQASDGAKFYYSTGWTNFCEYGNLPSNATNFESYNDLINDFGHNFFIRYGTVNKYYGAPIETTVINKSLGFVYNNKVYYIYGTRFNSCDINKNREYLKSIFGEENCGEVYDDFNNKSGFRCDDPDHSLLENGIAVIVYDNCEISAFDFERKCYIQDCISNCASASS